MRRAPETVEVPASTSSRISAIITTLASFAILSATAPVLRPAGPPTAPASATAPAADHPLPAKAAPKPRTINGHFARITYPVTVTTQSALRLDVTFKNLRGRAPKDLYRRVTLEAAEQGKPFTRVRILNLSPNGHVTVAARTPATPGRYRVRMNLERVGGAHILTTPVRVMVRDPSYYSPQGDPADWSALTGKNSDGSLMRWDPCSTVRWAFNPNGIESIYPQARDDLSAVLSRISARTGLHFDYAGASTKVPFKSSDAIVPSDEAEADLFIGFASEEEVSTFTVAVGLGGPLYFKKATDDTMWIDSGGVLLDSGQAKGARYRDSTAHKRMLALMTHEVLHAVGLGHAKTEQQVMYPWLRDTAKFGAGDLAGMQAYGSGQGCAPGYPTAIPASATPYSQAELTLQAARLPHTPPPSPVLD